MRDAWRVEIVRVLSRIAQHLEALQVVLQAREKEGYPTPKNNQTENAKTSPQVQQTPVLIEIESPVRFIEDTEAQDYKEQWNKKRFSLDRFLAAVLTLTLIVVGMQWCSMDATLKEMQNQTQPMIDAAKAADDAVEVGRLDLRAWVMVESARLVKTDFTIGDIPTVLLLITNSGHTPAIEVASASAVFSRASLTPEELSDKVTGDRTSSPVLGPGQPMSVLVESSEPFGNQGQIDAIKREGGHRLYVIGTIYYLDVFSRPHWTKFCFSTGSKALSIGMTACAEHNDIDREPKPNQ